MDKKNLIDKAQVEAALETEADVGFCLACGWQQDNVDSNSREVECTECGEEQVYGANAILEAGLVD